MKLTKTLDGYVVRVPDDVVAALGLKDGDVVDLRSITVTGDPAPREQTVFERLARPLPPGYKLDREEANAR